MLMPYKIASRCSFPFGWIQVFLLFLAKRARVFRFAIINYDNNIIGSPFVKKRAGIRSMGERESEWEREHQKWALINNYFSLWKKSKKKISSFSSHQIVKSRAITCQWPRKKQRKKLFSLQLHLGESERGRNMEIVCVMLELKNNQLKLFFLDFLLLSKRKEKRREKKKLN